MKNNLKKRIIASVMAITTMMSFCSIMPASAALTDITSETSENRAKLSMAYLGTGESPAQAAITDFDTTSWTVGQKFWVGVYLSDVKKMDEALASQLGLSSMFNFKTGEVTGGLFSVKCGVDYSSEYLDPVDVYPEDESVTGEEGFQTYAVEKLLEMPMWNDKYSVTGGEFEEACLEHSSVDARPTLSNPKTLSLGIESSNATKRVWRTASDFSNDPLYVFVAQFTLIKKPAAGTKLISVTRNANQFVLEAGTNGERFAGAWNQNRSVTPDENLKNVFDYTGDLDLFPAGAATINGITKKDGSFGTQYVGQAFDKGTYTLKYTTDQADVYKDLGADDVVKYYYGETGKTAVGDLTEMPNALTTDLNGKKIYAVVTKGGNTYVYETEGTLNVQNVTVTGITVKSTPGEIYTGNKIDFTKVTADATLSAGSPVTGITFDKDGNGASQGLKIYKWNGSAAGDQVTDAAYTTAGEYQFVVGTADKSVLSAPFTVKVNAETTTYEASVSTQKYKGTATLDKSMITLTKVVTGAATTRTTVTLADMLADTTTYKKVVLAKNADSITAEDAVAITADDVTVTDANYGWGVFVQVGDSTYKVAELKKKSSGGGGGGSTTSYLVTFKAGANGELASGESKTQSVDKNATVKSTPAVVAKDGYKFVGWSLDGKTVVDATSQVITKATTFTAVYEKAEEPTETPEPTVEPTVEPTTAPIIDANYTKPYASGYDDGSFAPNNNITRGELAAMIARLSYGDDLPDGMYEASFPDVDDDAWFNKYIGYLEDKDVLSGYEDGTFRPMNTITRGEISAVIARAQKYDLLTYAGSFADVDDSDWAKDYIETLAVKNIVTGYEDGTFGPYSPLTRAEAVAIINRVLAESEPVVTFTPNDIAGHWAETDILLAVNERMLAGMMAPVVEPEEIIEEVIEEDKAEVEEVEDEAEEAETDADETEEIAE